MPLTLSKIANNTASVSFLYGDDPVHITYYPSRITEKTFAALQAFAASDESTVIAGFGTLNDVLCTLIKSWDVYEDDAQTQMYPLTPDALAALPIFFRIQTLNAVTGDIRPEAMTPQTTQS